LEYAVALILENRTVKFQRPITFTFGVLIFGADPLFMHFWTMQHPHRIFLKVLEPVLVYLGPDRPNSTNEYILKHLFKKIHILPFAQMKILFKGCMPTRKR